MKTLIIALLISSVAIGQKIDTTKLNSTTLLGGIGNERVEWGWGAKIRDTTPLKNGYDPSVPFYHSFDNPVIQTIGNYNNFRGDISYRVKDTVPFIGFGVQIGEIEFGGAKSTIIMRPDSLKPLSRDTIPALFLVTDTSIDKSSAFAVKGYEVYKRNGSIDWLQKRLDSNKKPIPNTWVVWQTSIY